MNEKATRMYESLQGIFKNESETELKLLALKLTEVKHDNKKRGIGNLTQRQKHL